MTNKVQSLLKTLVSVSGMTLISRVVGFVRDMLTARYFGAGFATDAFNVAFKLPNLLRRVFAEGAFSQAFVPVLSEYRIKRTKEETKDFVASVIGILGLVLTVIVLLGIIFSSTVIWITAPGFLDEPSKFKLTIDLLRVTFPYILFISLASLSGGILNTWGVFSIPAFTPTLLNISYIVFILFFRHYYDPPIFTLAWAIFVGGLAQLLFQLYYLKKIDMLIRPKFNFHNQAVMKVIKLMGPAIFAVSISQISMVINTIFASFLQSGSISWMYYADRLMEFPTGVLGVALGTILLPSLSKAASQKNTAEFSRILDWGIRLCLILALPATIGLAILAKPLVMTLFMYGKFTLFDVEMTSNALVAYSVGLLGLILVKVLAPGFYANQDIKTPVKIAIFVLLMTQIMNLAFIFPFKHAGLSLSIGLAACINAYNLYRKLRSKGLYIPLSGWKVFIIKIICAVVFMAFALLISKHLLISFFMLTAIHRVLSLLLMCVIASGVYFSSLYVFGFRIKHFRYSIAD